MSLSRRNALNLIKIVSAEYAEINLVRRISFKFCIYAIAVRVFDWIRVDIKFDSTSPALSALLWWQLMAACVIWIIVFGILSTNYACPMPAYVKWDFRISTVNYRTARATATATVLAGCSMICGDETICWIKQIELYFIYC